MSKEELLKLLDMVDKRIRRVEELESLRKFGEPVQAKILEIGGIKSEKKVKEGGEVSGRGDGEGEEVVEGGLEDLRMNIIVDLKDPEHKSRCPYRDEWISRLGCSH